LGVSPEALLISSVLRDKDIDLATKHGIQPEHFHVFRDQWEWLANYANRHRKMPTKIAFRHQFPDFAIKAVNDTGYFSLEVKKAHAKRRMMKAISSVADDIGDGNIDEAVSNMQGSIIQIASGMGSSITDTDILSDWNDTFDVVSERHARNKEFGNAGIPTGFKTFDKAVGGLMPSYLTVIGARLGEGKSQTLAKMAVEAAVRGFSVMYVSLEQPRAEITMRLHSYLSRSIGPEVFNSIDLNQGKNFDLKKYRTFLGELREKVNGKLFVVDTLSGPLSVNDISVLVSRHKPDLVLVDYITLVKTSGSGEDWQSVGAVANGLKHIGAETQCSIVAAAQLNREYGLGVNKKSDEPPGPEALAQSDGIGQAADVVLTLRKLSTSVSKMKIAKHRHGVSGHQFYCQFQPGHGIFTEVNKSKAEELRDRDAETDDARMED
jgi:replicative DNA helicase